MRNGWKSRWGWRVSAVVLAGGLLVLGTGTMVTQAGDRDDDHNKRNPFEQILHKLDKILDAIKGGGGQEGNHTLRWDQNLPAAQRFVVLAAFNSEAVLDKNTGLVWEKSPRAANDTWIEARRFCINKTTGGQKGWRLPSIPELASLIDPSIGPFGISLPPGHPFLNVQITGDSYWSATTDADNPGLAWNAIFGGGGVGHNAKNFVGQAWCVRGGMNADQY
jgi:hypothetical protein